MANPNQPHTHRRHQLADLLEWVGLHRRYQSDVPRIHETYPYRQPSNKSHAHTPPAIPRVEPIITSRALAHMNLPMVDAAMTIARRVAA